MSSIDKTYDSAWLGKMLLIQANLCPDAFELGCQVEILDITVTVQGVEIHVWNPLTKKSDSFFVKAVAINQSEFERD